MTSEFNNAVAQHERVNLVWLSTGGMIYRPTLEIVDKFVRGLAPGLMDALKAFVVVGECPWLSMLLEWLPEHFDKERVEAFKGKSRFYGDLAMLQADWPGFQPKHVARTSSRLFGEPLETVCGGELPPSILELIEWLGQHGLEVDGIFRLSADSTQLEWMKSLLNSGRTLSYVQAHDANLMACLLKMYFRDLPSPIISPRVYPELMVVNPEDKPAIIRALREQILPRHSPQARILLGHLMRLLHAVAANEQKNRMNPKNLAICWAPNLIKDEGAKDQFLLLKSSLATIETMIENFDKIFC